MATIFVPAMAAFEDDLNTNLRLLEEIVLPKGHGIGLEIIGKPAHFLEQEGRERMIENLRNHASGLRLASHQWSGNIIYDASPENPAFSDLRTERGRKVLECGVDFAEEAIKAGLVPEGQEVYVHTHGGDLYLGEMPEGDLQRDKELIKQSLLVAAKRAGLLGVRIGLENLPRFPNSDDPELKYTPEKVGKTVIERLEDYRALVEGTELRLTFDTGHCAYELFTETRMDLVSAVDIFGEYLRHVHVSDIRGDWIPRRSMVGDGFIPGTGKIGEDMFKRFFRHLKDKYDLSEVGIESEVKDSDYSNPVNRRETLSRIVKWLD